MLLPTASGSPVASTDLGFVLPHEHIFTLSPEINQNFPATWGDEDTRIAAAVDKLVAAKNAGVDTIVDLTVIGLGRFIPRIQRVAAEVDINILVATGVYAWSSLPMHFAITGPGTTFGGPEFIDDLLVREIEDGIADTGIRPAVLKCAIGPPGPNADVTRVLRATASAHRRTGVPIVVHTHEIPNAVDAQRILEAEGVDLSRVMLSHLDGVLLHDEDLDYVESLVDRGSWIAVDQIGIPWVEDADEKRMDAIAELVRRGHSDRILLSHDSHAFSDMVPAAMLSGELAPNWKYTTVAEIIVPGLRERGVSDEAISTMTRDNPRRLLETTGAGPY
ncbi:phosphotriesterase [Georgenia sp. SYP-B2076]|uniref:phosphotriesterase family protein n=1 Tax=Georgenia sp. SYP-B2076 TaxID=2495881 RepID=UPI00197ABE95|nr:phosphotriesterase [Georgenia sp. SYP-B2076]